MVIDKQSAEVEAAAREHADAIRNGPRTLYTRHAVAAMLETAFIAGNCHAKRDTVVQFDAVLAAPQVRP